MATIKSAIIVIDKYVLQQPPKCGYFFAVRGLLR